MNGLFIGCGGLALGLVVSLAIEKHMEKNIIKELKKHLLSEMEKEILKDLRKKVLSDMDIKVGEFNERVEKLVEKYILKYFYTENESLKKMVGECKEMHKSLEKGQVLRVISEQTKEYGRVMDEKIENIIKEKIPEMIAEIGEKIKVFESNDRDRNENTRRLIEDILFEKLRGIGGKHLSKNTLDEIEPIKHGSLAHR